MRPSAAPANPRRPGKRERTAAHLSATAFRLFEAQGFDAVTMEQIAAEAGVAKATLYDHFPVKEALLAHRMREDIAAGMQERAAALAAHPTFESRMRYLLTESAQWNSARRAYLPAYLRYLTRQARYGEGGASPANAKAAPIDNGTRGILAAMFAAAQQSGEIDPRLDVAMLAASVEYLLFGAVAGWLEDPSIDLTTRFLAAFDLALHGMAARPTSNVSGAP
ncbi:MAG: TetR/AcrR family transcriptional regulator [Xanthomonadales bacterium]|nr:TetR/AcrR family transcriptional regulator [Xanthomonadales bacterium]